MKTKVKNLIKKIEAVGLIVHYDDSDEKNPHIEIYRNEKKQSILEIVFDKKGKATDIVVSKNETNSCWINLKKLQK